ncbi:MAG: hypothetical protein ACI4PP_03320 [Clostridia bacterium]
MKKKLIIVMALTLLFAFTACEPEEQTSTTTDNKFDSYIGGELTDLMTAIDELGYTATYYNQGEDWTDILPLDETWAQDFLVGKIEEDPDTKTVNVDLKLKSNAEQDEIESALEEKLEIGSAWAAVEKYGQQIYGDGFEVDYIVGRISSYAEDENTWFLKATGKLNGEDVTCEALVTGTTENPEVLSLDVY